MTRPPSRAAGPVLILVAAFGSVLGCAGAGKSSGTIGSGSGGSGGKCTTTACLPLVAPSAAWTIEIDPPSSPDAGVTFTAPPPLGPDQTLHLMADSLSPVTATFTAPANTAPPSVAAVILTVPSSIPGRPALTFQPQATATSNNITTGSLLVPSKLVQAGVAATLALVPLPPPTR